MRVGGSLPVFLVLGALIALPAAADEVVHFTNGTSLVISSHEIEKDMVSVELGSNSRMGFPLYMVDKIESAGRSVYLNPTYHPSNQVLAATAGGAPTNEGPHPVTGAGGVPSRFRSPQPTPVSGGGAGNQLKEFNAMWGAGLQAAANPGYVQPAGEDTADRSAAEMRALQSGIPLPQPPQNQQRLPGRTTAIRVAPRAHPIGSGGGGTSGNPTPPPAPVDPGQQQQQPQNQDQAPQTNPQ